MSHAIGKILVEGKTIGWFEYNGTVDVARPQVFATSEDVCAHWREPQPARCLCAGVPCEVWTAYGNLAWPSRFCAEHGFIVGALDPYSETDDEPIYYHKRWVSE